jgi:GWxTD domain-containing protein
LPTGLFGQTADQGVDESLEVGDTARAIALIQQQLDRDPDSGELHLRMGALLAATASTVERDYADRRLARAHLDRAIELLGEDPTAYYHLGILLEKQNLRVDALRVLNRAIDFSARRDRPLTTTQWANIHLVRASNAELEWRDWEDLVWIPPTARDGWPCPSGGTMRVRTDEERYSIIGTACPRTWWRSSGRAVHLEELKEDRRLAAMKGYRAVLELDGSSEQAAGGLLRLLGDEGAWAEYVAVVDAFLAAEGDPHRGNLYRGVALYRLHRFDDAREALAEANRRGDAEAQTALADVTLLISRKGQGSFQALDEAGRREVARRLFATSDPSYMTAANERELEHLVRVAWADLKFGAPRSGLRGWDTDPGRIYIRYGQPERRQQCCTPGDSEPTETWDYWSYGESGPVFSFRRLDTYRLAWLAGKSQFIADQLGETNPEWYRPTHITSVHAVAHQVARFRGGRPGTVALEFYAAPPYAQIGAVEGDTAEAGVFLFTEDVRPLWERRVTAPVVATDKPVLTYKVEVQPGRYLYSLEARRAGPDSVPRPLGKSRGEVEATGYPDGGLALSDIVLARSVEPRQSTTPPMRRGDLAYRAAPTAKVLPGAGLLLFFEVYGVRHVAYGAGRIAVEVAVEDSKRRSAFVRLGRAIGRLFGADPEAATRISWERELPLDRGAGVEWFGLEPDGPLDAGGYRLIVRVRDLESGATAESVRRFTVGAEAVEASR